MPNTRDDPPSPPKPRGTSKPPHSTRFQPGTSGNPLGRPPKGGRPAKVETFTDVVLDEASRPMRVQDGDGSHSVQTSRVIVRRTSIDAASGDRHAQRAFARMLSTAERNRERRKAQLYDEAVDYIRLCELYCEQQHAFQETPSIFEINPVDIELDGVTGEVRLREGAGRRNAGALYHVRQLIAAVRKELNQIEECLIEQPGNPYLLDDKKFNEGILKRLDRLI